MKKFWTIIIVLVWAGCSPQASTNQVCFKGQCVDVEIVQKAPDLQRGLQFRKSLGEKNGMLFVFPKADRYSFWMKDTLIPLDMIWIDYARTIVYIAQGVPPCQSDPCPVYTPTGSALYVLEVNAGYAERLGLKEGVEVEFRLRE